jgi:hypothetical protein
VAGFIASPSRRAYEIADPRCFGSPALWRAVLRSQCKDARRDRPHNQDLAKVDGEIARLVDRSTQELRRAWQRLYHTGPPLGLSRDLIIRGLADKLQQRAHGGPSRALQRRLRILAGEFEKGAGSFDAGGVLKTGASLVRRWRGHTHTVLVGEDGHSPSAKVSAGRTSPASSASAISRRISPRRSSMGGSRAI